jgi:hypothetical protein
MSPDQLTIHHAQANQPWTIAYSFGVQAASIDKVPHILASHTALHAAKTVGKIAALFEDYDHTGNDLNPQAVLALAAMSADLVTEALRFANLYGFDLAAALVERVQEKNGVNILEQPCRSNPTNPTS